MSASDIAPAPSKATPRDEQAGSFLKRAEVRDALAWMRLLIDPTDAAAVVRALSRPPIELRQVDLARVIQIARRRKLDLVLGLTAATESPQVPPEARERIQRFVELHRSAAGELDTVEPDVFLGRLIDRLGVRGRPLLTPQDAADQQVSLERLRALAVEFVRMRPRSSTRDLARHLATVMPETQVVESAEGSPSESGESHLEGTLRLLREEVLDSVARIGGRLGELRLDTDLDISHGVVRYLELLKLSALLQRPEGQELPEALADINARLLAATTPLEREIFQTSTLDEVLQDDEGDQRTRAQALLPREEHSLGPFLPKKGIGLALSASDIQTYRSCPLRYKFARVLRIPTEQTVHQRFGIVVHQVLERYHSEQATTLAEMLELLEVVWRRSALGERPSELELMDKARVALTRYHARLGDQESEPVWFERAFAFRLGPHHLRGRVDRVDRLAEGSEAKYELIDYKTSRPKSAEQLADDVQLSLYALAAREAWQLESSRQAYYYVLDDLKVPVPRGERDAQAVTDIVLEVGEGILAQAFEPTPSHAACSICDYRIVCPAAE
ncbi:MAG TPA: PD-(D/E)XK nuclease family protein [Solirubrobacteraceae bacterium]|nr:PD-(D/E)XK nuclease family protein [Solirubrobacteraceae bacterium]